MENIGANVIQKTVDSFQTAELRTLKQNIQEMKLKDLKVNKNKRNLKLLENQI